MEQNEKVTVKLTLEMNVKEALAAFECETVKDVVDCTVQELNDLFTGTYSGLTITESEIIEPVDKPVRKKGKWIPFEFEHMDSVIYCCSNCGQLYESSKTYPLLNFCPNPNCGAEMEAEECTR